MKYKNLITYKSGIYKMPNDNKHYVEVTVEGIIFCCTTNGYGEFCGYPYFGELCDDCPLRRNTKSAMVSQSASKGVQLP